MYTNITGFLLLLLLLRFSFLNQLNRIPAELPHPGVVAAKQHGTVEEGAEKRGETFSWTLLPRPLSLIGVIKNKESKRNWEKKRNIWYFLSLSLLAFLYPLSFFFFSFIFFLYSTFKIPTFFILQSFVLPVSLSCFFFFAFHLSWFNPSLLIYHSIQTYCICNSMQLDGSMGCLRHCSTVSFVQHHRCPGVTNAEYIFTPYTVWISRAGPPPFAFELALPKTTTSGFVYRYIRNLRC